MQESDVSPAVIQILEDYAREICTSQENAEYLMQEHIESLIGSLTDTAVYFWRIKPEYRDSFKSRKFYGEGDDLLTIPLPPLALALEDLAL